MSTALITAGIACIIAAVVGGGLKIFNIEIPVLKSWFREIVLAAFGIILVYLGITYPNGNGSEPTITPLASDAPLSSTILVYEAILRADPFDYTGPCPKLITFSGRISVSQGSGIVSYKFIRSDGANAPVQSLSFDGPSSKDVSDTWQLGSAGSSYSGWEAIHVLSPQEMTSSHADFTIQCQ